MKIERGIEIPPSGRSKYPTLLLKVGESFFIDGKIVSQVWGAITPTARKHGIEVEMRSVVEKGKKGVRVWRVK